MPAKHVARVNDEGVIAHIYNEGVDNKLIFQDKLDYEVFVNYLKEYLSPPHETHAAKREFTVKGKTYHGKPHQPKNYFGEVELLAYALKPTHFHLILKQKSKGALERFVRSLCTRYSMYVNKRYARSGTLFRGPYKSRQIETTLQLLLLGRHIHLNCDESSKTMNTYSSFPEYLGESFTSWVNSKPVLSEFSKIPEYSDQSYKEFLDKKVLTDLELEAIAQVLLEPTNKEPYHHALENNDETLHFPGQSTPKSILEPKGKVQTSTITKQSPIQQNLEPISRVPELFIITTIFMILFSIGIKNINADSSKDVKIATNVSITPTTITPALKVSDLKPEVKTEVLAIDSIEDNSSSDSSQFTSMTVWNKNGQETNSGDINTVKIVSADPIVGIDVHLEADVTSPGIATAKNDQIYQVVSILHDWYGIRLPNGKTGYVLSTYIKEHNQLP
jgi:putative transposase